MYHLQRELLRERTRCKALEEELENPMNIHRWRKLEGSDPSTYEMIQKIQTLQVRVQSARLTGACAWCSSTTSWALEQISVSISYVVYHW